MMTITVQEMYELVKELAQAEESRFLELKDKARETLRADRKRGGKA